MCSQARRRTLPQQTGYLVDILAIENNLWSRSADLMVLWQSYR
jgi:hypothetical protein